MCCVGGRGGGGSHVRNLNLVAANYCLQVFGAIRQAVQRAPYYPESHNLKGLVCEARFEYQTAAASYRQALCALTNFSSSVSKSQIRDISINLARSLSKVKIFMSFKFADKWYNAIFIFQNFLSLF